jgi:hypothetical protein
MTTIPSLDEMTESLDRAQIRALRDDAGVAGDLEMVAVCERAIDGNEAARRECARVLRDARIAAM